LAYLVNNYTRFWGFAKGSDMTINPWEIDLLSSGFKEVLRKKRYKTVEQIERYLGTDAGKRLYVEYERYMTIKFKSGKKVWYKPSVGYLGFEPIKVTE